MKKIIIVVPVLCFGIAACNNQPKSSSEANQNSETQKNLQAAHNISRAFETGNTALIDSFVSKDFIDHRDLGDVKSLDSLKAMVNNLHAHIKDMKSETIKEMADDDYVMQWMHLSGRGDGQGNTMNGDFNVKGVEITRFKNGKAIEHWEAMDMQDVSKLMQSMMRPNEVDSTTVK